MPMSSSRVSMVKVGQTLLLLMLLLLPERQGQNIPHHHSNLVRENELGTFENSHILVKERENDVYLYKGISRNFTFTVSKNCTIIVTVTPCASEITWTLHALSQAHSDLSWIGDQHHSLAKNQRLAQFEKSEKRETIHVSASKGSYILTVTSLRTDSHVKIFVSTNLEIGDSVYPSVPASSQISVLTNQKTLILDWPSASAVNRFRKSVEYCVTISRIKNFHSHCEALAHVYGDKKPVFVDWGFPAEKEKLQEHRSLANPIKPAPKKMISHQCVSNKTSLTFTKAGRGKTYHVDVFIIDKDTQMASAYTGTTVKIKFRKRSPKTRMKVGETRTINLKRKLAIELKINSTLSRLAFEVVPCAGKIPFELYYNGKRNQTKTLARRWRRHFVRNAQPGTYLLTFPGKKKKKTFVTVYITSKPSRSKIVVPKRRKIRVFGKLITCSTVTVAWMGSSVEQNYCLYKKMLKKNRHDSKRRRCLSPDERPETERQTCVTHSGADSARQAITYNVTGLQPDTWYRFDVFVRRGRSAPVPYKSVKVKTLAQCVS